MRKLIIVLLGIGVVILAATQLIEYHVLDGKFVIPPGETKQFDVVLYTGAWIRVEAYSNSTVYSTRRLLMIYILDDLEYYGLTGTNDTLREMIRAACVAAWQVGTDNSVNAVYLDKVSHDSRYHIVLDNNPPAFFSSNPKTVELHITTRAPYPALSYLAAVPIVAALALLVLDKGKIRAKSV